MHILVRSDRFNIARLHLLVELDFDASDFIFCQHSDRGDGQAGALPSERSIISILLSLCFLVAHDVLKSHGLLFLKTICFKLFVSLFVLFFGDLGHVVWEEEELELMGQLFNLLLRLLEDLSNLFLLDVFPVA